MRTSDEAGTFLSKKFSGSSKVKVSKELGNGSIGKAPMTHNTQEYRYDVASTDSRLP